MCFCATGWRTSSLDLSTLDFINWERMYSFNSSCCCFRVFWRYSLWMLATLLEVLQIVLVDRWSSFSNCLAMSLLCSSLHFERESWKNSNASRFWISRSLLMHLISSANLQFYFISFTFCIFGKQSEEHCLISLIFFNVIHHAYFFFHVSQSAANIRVFQ